jgi:predicted nuclease with RNAse H fold
VAVAVDHLGRRLPRRVERANDRGGLRKAPVLGATFRPREVCRGRRYKLLRGLKLARYLRTMGIEVLEVERPEHRRRSSRSNLQKKSDPSHAERGARAVLAGEVWGVRKERRRHCGDDPGPARTPPLRDD